MSEAEQQIEETPEVEEVLEVEVSEEIQVEAEAEEEPREKPEMTQDDIRLVEAILFASPAPIAVSAIAERFPQDRVSLLPEILKHLQELYESRGVNLVKRSDKWALRTASDLGEQMKLEKEQTRKFTKAAMETMAVISYHQPVTRAEIENIRGVATSPGSLDALMEAGWIKPGKRREVPGRPVTWVSTKEFLDHFGLESLKDLPGMEELQASGLLDKRAAIDAMPKSGDLFDEDINKDKDGEDPQEVTDEDLLGSHENDEVEALSEETDIEDDINEQEEE